MHPLPDNFRYLNREGRWLGFHWDGLEVAADGALQLLSSPRLVGVPPDLTKAPTPDGPSGIAVDESGRIFYSVPDQNTVFAFGGCAQDAAPLGCLAESAGLEPLDRPRGLLILDHPQRLVIADSGNHRLLFFDLVDFNVRDVWDFFDTPWTVCSDSTGNLYVLDYGAKRVEKFRRTADSDDRFAERVSSLVPKPAALAVQGENVFVFDEGAGAIYVFDLTGSPVQDADGNPIAIRHDGMTDVLALVATPDRLYAGDNHLRRILSFKRGPGFPFAGEAAGFEGPVSAIAAAIAGGLVISAGGQILNMTAAGAYLPTGNLHSDAISSGRFPAVWNRLRAEIQKSAGAHIEFYYAVSHSSTPPSSNFSDPAWTELPNDVSDFLLSGPKAYNLFVGAIFRSDQTATPRLRQMRADFDERGYLPLLPAIYREPAAQSDFLRRFLALFQGIFNDIEGETDSLARYFNPYSAPAETLPWLASWLAVDLDQGEPVARIRMAIARAFRRYQWRGTAEGLKLALLEDAGIHANIVQPIASVSPWSFTGDTHCSGVSSTPEGVPLGAGSTLSAMQPGPPVLNSTAQLDHSYLISDAEFGEPLFDGSAYQFVVEVYRSEVDSNARLALVKEIVEREKPAHTMWRLSILEPSMQAGAQARIGIDAIVAGTPGPSGLGEGALRLAGGGTPRTGESRLGQDLKLEQ